MRRFLNAYIEVKQKVPDILPMVYIIMEKNQWGEERHLFFMEDINDVKSEKRTPHAMLSKAFPEIADYWHVSEKSNEQEGKWFGYFSNFPGFVDGKAVFMPEDKGVTRELLAGIAEKIPKPCAFYQTSIALDGMRWYKDSNTAPAIDWQAFLRYPDGNLMPGEMNTYDFFFNAKFYQSNCILLDKRFDMRPALIIRIELTEEHPREEALAIVEKFQEVFGTAKQNYTKIYTITVSPWEEKERLLERQVQMQDWYNQWCERTILKLNEYATFKVTSMSQDVKVTSVQTLQKRVVKECGLERHEIRPWDGYGWCKQLTHNFWLYVELVAEPVEPEHYNYEHKLNNYMRLYCYGDNFHLFDHINMRSFVKAPWNIMAGIAFEGYVMYLKLFEEEVVPKLAEVFGDTDNAFYQESYEFDHYWQDNLLGGWMDAKRCAKEFMW